MERPKWISTLATIEWKKQNGAQIYQVLQGSVVEEVLTRLIRFVFPPDTQITVTLQYKIRLHEQLAELVADRATATWRWKIWMSV